MPLMARAAAVSPFDWAPPQVLECPRCCAEIVVRYADPRCPVCGLRESTS